MPLTLNVIPSSTAPGTGAGLPDLVTPDDIGLNVSTLSGDDVSKLASAIKRACARARSYCRQNFTQATYDQLYNSNDLGLITLQQRPVNQVLRVAAAPFPVLSVANTSTANQRATCGFTTTGTIAGGDYQVTGLTLTAYSGGTSTVQQIPFVSGGVNQTVTQVAAAIKPL